MGRTIASLGMGVVAYFALSSACRFSWAEVPATAFDCPASQAPCTQKSCPPGTPVCKKEVGTTNTCNCFTTVIPPDGDY